MTTSPPDHEHSAQPERTEKKKPSLGRRLVAVMCFVIVVALLIPVSNLFTAPPEGTPLATRAVAHGMHLEAAAVLEKNCLDCHSDLTRTPFYGRVPPAKSLIEKDKQDGMRYLDMDQAFVPERGKPVSQVVLAKLEYVVDHGSMPPARYKLMHWNRGLSAGDKDDVLGWVRRVRREHYVTEGVAEPFREGALQPLPQGVTLDEAKVALGSKLFHDTRLSGDGTLSCASCHGLDTGGTDQLKTSTGIKGAVGPINAPTVYNAGFQFKQFWDGRAATLEEQAAGPVANPIEMGADWDQAVADLREDEGFVEEFTAAYPGGVTRENITHAIAEFERSLITPNSRFDQYLMGKKDALTAEELEGHRLFLDNACATCHAGKILGGQSFELMGLRRDYFAERGGVVEADHGRFNVTKDEQDRHRFKVPTLRNIALTYPYFHDGSTDDLAEAVTVMATYQAPRPFTDGEANKVAKFLRTLTGEYQGTQLQ